MAANLCEGASGGYSGAGDAYLVRTNFIDSYRVRIGRRGRNVGSVCGVNSFSAETVVVTTDGNVAISEIEVGDTVLAYNEATGETGEYLW